jgi:hypothetical protein
MAQLRGYNITGVKIMNRNLIAVKSGLLSLLAVILFTGVKVSANENNSSVRNSPSNEIIKLTINRSNLIMYPGGSFQLIASAMDNKGKKIAVTPSWKIKSEVPSFGEIDKTEGDRVIFNALTSGCGSLIAVYNNVEAEVHVEIFKPGHSNKQLHKQKKQQ